MYRLWLNYKVTGCKDLVLSIKVPIQYKSYDSAEHDANNYKCIPHAKGRGCLTFNTYTAEGNLIDTVHMIELSKYRMSPYIVCFDTLYEKYLCTTHSDNANYENFITMFDYTIEDFDIE